MSFSELGLIPEILQAVTDAGYTEPTPIQRQAIPVVLAGHDVMGGAQTGTGKTAGFTLPLLNRLARHASTSTSPARHQVRALILAPTRELAMQVYESVKMYSKHLPLRSTCIYGGVDMNPQIQELRRGIEIVVATPGRLLDHVQQKTIALGQVEFLILDEAVAVKVLTEETADSEAKLMATVSRHPSIVDVYDTGVTDDGHRYLVMRLFHGNSYAEIIRSSGPLPVEISEAIDAGKLPEVSFYKPQGNLNQHSGYADIASGDHHIAEVIHHLEHSPQWGHMLVVVTYDENGGLWDHVAPPKGDRWGPGTRIPAIIVSPYAKHGYVDHTLYDTNSILRFIIHRFDLPNLEGIKTRDAAMGARGQEPLGDLSGSLNLI